MSNSNEVLAKIDPLNKIMLSNQRGEVNILLEDLCKKVHIGALDQIMDYIEKCIEDGGQVDLNNVKDACKKSTYIQF